MTASSLRSSVAVRPSRSSYCGSSAAPQDPAAEPVALVGDQQPAAGAGRDRLVRGRRVARRDEHVAVGRYVLAAVAEPADPRVGERRGEPAVPLLHEHARRNDHQHEAAPAQRVGGRRDRDVGLARAGDGLDHAPAAAAQPAHEGVELPAVELAVGRHGGTTVPAGGPRPVDGAASRPDFAPYPGISPPDVTNDP